MSERPTASGKRCPDCGGGRELAGPEWFNVYYEHDAKDCVRSLAERLSDALDRIDEMERAGVPGAGARGT